MKNEPAQPDPNEKKPAPNDKATEPPKKKVDEWRALLAELFGTFMLTMVGAGGVVIGHISHGEIEHAAKVVAPGLLVMGMIYSIGEISGAHLNPGVTLAFILRRDFPWQRVPGYWTAQFAGALLAAGLLRSLFGNVVHLGAPEPHHGLIPAVVMEVVLTTLLVSVIVGTAKDHRLVGPNAAIAVGGTIALCGLFSSPISGASMNPATSLGPYLVSGDLTHAWIYIVGPITGAVLASILAFLIHGQPNPSEEEAASGEGTGG